MRNSEKLFFWSGATIISAGYPQTNRWLETYYTPIGKFSQSTPAGLFFQSFALFFNGLSQMIPIALLVQLRMVSSLPFSINNRLLNLLIPWLTLLRIIKNIWELFDENYFMELFYENYLLMKLFIDEIIYWWTLLMEIIDEHYYMKLWNCYCFAGK